MLGECGNSRFLVDFKVISMNSEDSGLRLFRWIRVARKRVVVVVVVVARSPCVSPTRDSCNAASFRSECLLQDRTLQLLQMVLGSCRAALRKSKLSFNREEDFGRIRPGFGRRNWTRFLHFQYSHNTRIGRCFCTLQFFLLFFWWIQCVL
jgi:hypothetical protein